MPSFFSRVLGAKPQNAELHSYLEAYFGDRITEEQRAQAISVAGRPSDIKPPGWWTDLTVLFSTLFGSADLSTETGSTGLVLLDEATTVAKLLIQSTEEMDSILVGLDGGYIKPAPGGGN